MGNYSGGTILAVAVIVALAATGGVLYFLSTQAPVTPAKPGQCTSVSSGCYSYTSTWKITVQNALNGTLWGGTTAQYQIRDPVYGAVLETVTLSSGTGTTARQYTSGQQYVLRTCVSVTTSTCSPAFTADETVQDILVTVPFSTTSSCSTAPCMSTTLAITTMTSTKGSAPFGLISIANQGTVGVTFDTVGEGSYTSGNSCSGTGVVGFVSTYTCAVQGSSTQASYVITLANLNTASPAGDSGYPGTFGVYGSTSGLPANSPLGMWLELRQQANVATIANSTTMPNGILTGTVTGPFQSTTPITYSYSATDKAFLYQLTDNALSRRTAGAPQYGGVATIGFTFDDTGLSAAHTGAGIYVILKVYLSGTYFTQTGGNNIEEVNSVIKGFTIARFS